MSGWRGKVEGMGDEGSEGIPFDVVFVLLSLLRDWSLWWIVWVMDGRCSKVVQRGVVSISAVA